MSASRPPATQMGLIAMSLYTDYLNEIEERKSQNLALSPLRTVPL